MKLVLDLDDVLCNFVGAWNEWLFACVYSPTLLTRQDILTYDHYIKHFNSDVLDFYTKQNCYESWVTPFEGSHDFLEWCQQNFDDVMILSHASTEESKEHKTMFVEQNFGFKNIKFSNSKVEKFNFTNGSILVDDYPENVLKHIKNNKMPGVIFNRLNLNAWSTIMNHHNLLKDMDKKDFDNIWYISEYESLKELLLNLK